MMRAIYRPGDSLMHRAPAGVKLLALALLAICVSAGGWRVVILAAALMAVGWMAARLDGASAAQTLRAMMLFAIVIFVAQAFLQSPAAAALVVVKLAILILGATLVSMTTKVADMLATLERALAPLKAVGLKPAQVSFLVVLGIRFVPAVFRIGAEVREAQRARGLERHPFAATVPILIRTLREADAVAEALAARGWSPR